MMNAKVSLVVALLLISVMTVSAQSSPVPVLYGQAFFDDGTPADGGTVSAFLQGNAADMVTDTIGVSGSTGLPTFWKVNLNNLATTLQDGDNVIVRAVADGKIEQRLYIVDSSEGTKFMNLTIDIGGVEPVDVDNDGWTNDLDCDDSDPNVNPDAAEICDGVDNDCDKAIDEGGDSLCSNDLFCDGIEMCEGVGGCVAGIPVVCTGNDLEEINSCAYDPDNNDLTRDTADTFISTCDEETDSCTVGSQEVVSACDLTCGATCTADEHCAETSCAELNGCVEGEIRSYFPSAGTCNDSCGCDPGVCEEFEVIGSCEDVIIVNIPIFNGWTLIALPYNPIGFDNSEELGNAINSGVTCDLVMRFDGLTQTMIDDIIGQPDPSFLLTGTEGYYVGCDGDTTLSYEGVPW